MSKVIKINSRRKLNINIGFVILAIIFIYTIICSIIYLTKKKVTVYEVQRGSISDSMDYRGFIIRDEETIISQHTGDLNYIVFENERVSVNSNICCVDNTGVVSDYVSQLKDKTTFAEDDLKKLNTIVSSYKRDFANNDFGYTYDFKNLLNKTIQTSLNENIMDDMNHYIENDYAGNLISTDKTGVIMYGYDGLESFDIAKLKYEDFDSSNYKYNSLIGTDKISAGDIAYRIITSEKWNIYIKLSDADIKKLENTSSIQIRFLDSKITTTADFEIYRNQYGVYGKISLNKYMSNYSGNRYVELEIISSNMTGLKIPKSAIVEKDFYCLPKYLVKTNNATGELGVSVKTPNKKGDGYDYGFVAIDIYDSDEDNYYIDNSAFSKNQEIIGVEDSYVYTLSVTKKIKGVYRINKGYTVFRKIEIIDENEDFYIISNSTPYGLSIYDRIVFDSKDVVENEILY